MNNLGPLSGYYHILCLAQVINLNSGLHYYCKAVRIRMLLWLVSFKLIVQVHFVVLLYAATPTMQMEDSRR